MPERFAPEGEAHAFLPLNARSAVYENARLAFAGPCRLFGFHVYNNKASAQFIQLFDSEGLPADGQVPEAFWTVTAGSQLDVTYTPHGRVHLQGVVLCNSSTGPTKTGGAADCWFDVQVL